MTRSGCLVTVMFLRTNKLGLSTMAVPTPINTASDSDRNRCTISNDSAHVKRSGRISLRHATPPFRSKAIFNVIPRVEVLF